MHWEGGMKRDVPEYSTGCVRRGFFLLFWADTDHVVTILSAGQQVVNVAAVSFIIFKCQQAQSRVKVWLGYCTCSYD